MSGRIDRNSLLVWLGLSFPSSPLSDDLCEEFDALVGSSFGCYRGDGGLSVGDAKKCFDYSGDYRSDCPLVDAGGSPDSGGFVSPDCFTSALWSLTGEDDGGSELWASDYFAAPWRLFIVEGNGEERGASEACLGNGAALWGAEYLC